MLILIVKPRTYPDRPDYSRICKQTITVYNVLEDKDNKINTYHRTVINNAAFIDFKRQWQESKTGTTASTPALVIIPQGADGNIFIDSIAFASLDDIDGCFTLREGDKVFDGIGPDIDNAKDWSLFIPVKAHGVVVVKAIDIKKTFGGDIAHIEAGG